MKRFLILSVAVLFSSNIYAQPGRGYAKRAIEDKYEKDNAGNKQKGMDWLANAMNGKTESEYNFPMSITMHVTSYKDGEKKSESDMQYFVNTGKKYFGAKIDDEKRKKRDMGLMIYDLDNNTSIMLNETEKTGIAININAFMSKEAQENRGKPKSDGAYKNDCKKSGKTKTIQGYNCEEYVCIDEDRNRKTEIYITNKIAVDISQSFARSPYAYMNNLGNLGAGMMMESTHYKNNQIESKMEVTEINKSANYNVKMSDYKMGAR